MIDILAHNLTRSASFATRDEDNARTQLWHTKVRGVEEIGLIATSCEFALETAAKIAEDCVENTAHVLDHDRACPHFPRLREGNTRRGFLDGDQIDRICAALVERLARATRGLAIRSLAVFRTELKERTEPKLRELEPDGGLAEANRRASQRSVSPREGCWALP